MAPQNIQGNIFDWKIVKRISQYIKPYLLLFLTSIFLVIIIGALAPLKPYIVKLGIDESIAQGDQEGLMQMVFLLIIITITQALMQFFHNYLSGWLGQQIIKDIRIELYQFVLKMKIRFFDKTSVGQLVTRCVSDIETLSRVFTDGFAAILGDILQLLFIVGAMFYIDWRLTLITLSTIPVLLVATYIFKEKMKIAFSQVRNAVSSLNTFVQEHIVGMSVVQIFNSEERELKKFEKLNKQHLRANIKTVNYYSLYYPISELLSIISTSLLVIFGAKFVFEGDQVELGTLIAFIMLLHSFFRPIRMIADRFNIIQLGIVSSNRILNLLDKKEEIEEEKTGMAEIKGSICFKNVSFAYTKDEYVLKNISFEIKPNQSIAFVGATGAGKSSIIRLINKYYPVNEGQILIDQTDISQFNTGYLRRSISTVLQDIFLFSGSIRENITLGRKDISDADIFQIFELLGATELIEVHKEKLDYKVMETGGTLSTGQRQLICFARAIISQPKILILDEATASIDSKSEELIQKATLKMMKNRTSIIIAHRLSTIKKVDKIMVIHEGEIVEEGTHEELLMKKEYYYKLYNIQREHIY